MTLFWVPCLNQPVENHCYTIPFTQYLFVMTPTSLSDRPSAGPNHYKSTPNPVSPKILQKTFKSQSTVPYTPCPEPYPPSKTDQVRAQVCPSPHKTPILTPRQPAILRPKVIAHSNQTSGVSQDTMVVRQSPHFPFSLLPVPLPSAPSTKQNTQLFSQRMLPHNVPYCLFFLRLKSHGKHLRDSPSSEKRSRKPHTTETVFFPPKSDTHRCAPRSNICAWDFCTSDFVEHLLLHCLFEKSPWIAWVLSG